jgi:hypothetical protein
VTALCGGGASAPKLLPDLAATYSAGRLAQLLVGAGIGELSAWLPLVGLIPVVYSNFCSTDPPTMVALSRAESDALANNTIGADFFNGIGKFKDVLLNLIWLDVCQCSSGTMTPPTVPAVNVNTPVFQPPVGPNTAPCRPVTTVTGLPAVSAGGGTSVWPHVDSFDTNSGWSNVGGSLSTVRVHAVNNIVTGAGLTFAGFVIWQLDNLTTVRNDFFTTTPGQIHDFDFSPPVTATQFAIGYNSTGSGTGNVNNSSVSRYCNGAIPGAQQQPCCPPDVSTQAYLDLILQQVNLIQRQAVPFAYIASTAHTGLSGAGQINVSGLLGVKIHLTTIPSSYGRQGTFPTEYFDLGWVSFGTADGFPSGVRLSRADQLLLPARCSAYTELDYDLAPGVVATITELVREP